MTSYGVERMETGKIVRIFSTQAAYEDHRMRLAQFRRKWRARMAWTAIGILTLLILLTLISYALGPALGPVDRFNAFFYWGGAIVFAIEFLLYLLEEIGFHQSTLREQRDEIENMHKSMTPVAWEVQLDSGESVTLKGYSGRTGDLIGVNFIGLWTPSIYNHSEALRSNTGAAPREQEGLELRNTVDQNSLFDEPFTLAEYYRQEQARIDFYLSNFRLP